MGHISLAVPIVHIWYFRSAPSKIGNILGLSGKDSSASCIMNRTLWLSWNDRTEKNGFPPEEQYYDVLGSLPEKNHDLEDNDEKKFIAKIGGEAIKDLLKRVDVEILAAELRIGREEETSVQKKEEISQTTACR